MEGKLHHIATNLQLLPRFIVIVKRLSGPSRTLDENLGSFRQEISQLGHLINSLSKGSLTPGFISSEELKRVLEEIDASLPRGWMLSIPIVDSIWSYYEGLAVTAVPTETGWTVLIPILIQLEDISSFKLFEGLPSPLMNPNTTLLLSQNCLRNTWPYLLIEPNTSH